MERRTLGPNGFKVPVVGMGTSRTFDVRGRAAEATSRRIVEEALDAGANLFDSSPMYGVAERVLGLALDGRPLPDGRTAADAFAADPGRAAEARALLGRVGELVVAVGQLQRAELDRRKQLAHG